MKKIIVSILASIYLCSMAGITVHLHYCMGEVINWGLRDTDGGKCDKCGMEKDGKCCKDEQKFLKNNTDQKIAEPVMPVSLAATFASPAFLNTSEYYFSGLIENLSVNPDPPLKSGFEILLLNCVFRI